ncbi:MULTISPECIES: LysE family translocator [Erwiniaceae]|uniref:LysE family translocator n=1 Tax=Erwiniaceae TaxID=1903409 RepID=UPI00190B52F3|nr:MULTISPECIES: LysE family translocator [Erwiniaceae]MBK0091040.1 LysE family translocator [Erwinia sp. S59]MBK0122622.1 LysE family translocator [Pantoea sp. S61]MBK0122669.1 LysE family translocator [Pantoea sp. S61]
MNLSLLLAYMLAILLLLMTPGPVVALVTGTAARHGYRRAFATVVGTNAASLVLIALAALMLTGLVSINPRSLQVAGLLGSLFMGVIAWQGLRAATSAIAHRPAAQGGLLKGFVVGISNPKDILFFAALFPQFIAITPYLSSSLITLALVWMAFDFAVLAFYIITVKRWLPGAKQLRMERVSMLILLLIALAGAFYNLRELLL